MASIEKRVARGAALLDRVWPDWYQQVSIDRLSMPSCTDCIGGQLYGHYWAFANKIHERFERGESAADYGFCALQPEVDNDDPSAVYEALEVEWVEQITKRIDRMHCA